MKIRAISNFSTKKVSPKNINSTPMKPAFKADVRIADKYYDNDSVSDEQVNQMERLLEEAKTAYQDIGNDNLLVILSPVIRKRFLAKDAIDIAAVAVYKDTEKARLDIIEQLKSDFKDSDDMIKPYVKKDGYTDYLTQSAFYYQNLSVTAGEKRKPVTTKKALDWFITMASKSYTLGEYRPLTKGQHIKIYRDKPMKDTIHDALHPDFDDLNPNTIGTPSP